MHVGYSKPNDCLAIKQSASACIKSPLPYVCMCSCFAASVAEELAATCAVTWLLDLGSGK